MIDLIIVSSPLQFLIAVLFVATSGHIQTTIGVGLQSCSKAAGQYDTLVPPPPADSNFTLDCGVYFFGAQTARHLVVGSDTQAGMTRTIVSRSYFLDRDGRLVDAVSADWIVMLVLIIYWVIMEARAGATLGNRVTRTRVVDILAPYARGTPLSRIIARYLVMGAGCLPLFAVYVIYAIQDRPDVDATRQGSYLTWFVAAGVLAFIWFVMIFVQVARRRDPIYDRVAGTAVLLQTAVGIARTSHPG